LQGAGLGTLLPALSKAAYGTLDPKLRPEGTALFSPSRVYGGMIGIALAQMFFYTNTQSMHLALVKNQTPHRAAAHTAGAIMKSRSCRSQRCGQPTGRHCRRHRPVQYPDVGDADRGSAGAFSAQAAASQLRPKET
jgi:hypothetical protein